MRPDRQKKGRLLFDSDNAYIAIRDDVSFWSPVVDRLLRRHSLWADGETRAPDAQGTFPTFMRGELVLKLFGHLPGAQLSFEAERAALSTLADHDAIPAPRLLADGALFEGGGVSWPHLILTRIPGVAWQDSVPSAHGARAIAEQVGAFVGRLHAMRPAGIVGQDHWQPFDAVSAARLSSLPDHLALQAPDFIARSAKAAEVFVHGDLTASHIFVDGGRLSGVIDWGDSMMADPHYELIQVFRDLLGCDRVLFRHFLKASEWKVEADFPQRAMAQALVRQSVGMTQHTFIDVFEPIAERYPLHEFTTLNDLACTLFGN